MLNLLLDYSNQGESQWGMSVFLKGCNFEHTELSYFISYHSMMNVQL